ncbi:GGDEF domain-containing protein [Reinekea sp.]|jgi:diguanylate cyclase (GGDEF)-like protein|uniref:GGDEF domain-containing protein n=1 Tax=Reinekea sp. TaxID=1970455 RepID=UPI002A7F7FA8|nr:GGDEF domain-containing protein [Reinekea sp.]
MFANFLRPSNLSKKMMRVIFSIYLGVSCLVTSGQFLTEYWETQGSILDELKQLEEAVRGPIATSLWQNNQAQMDALIVGLIKMPIVEGVDVLDKSGKNVIFKRSFPITATPVSMFDTRAQLYWTVNDNEVYLGSLVLYSSSEVVLNRVFFGFALLALTAIIKLSVLFLLFIWAFDRHLTAPLRELMSQINEVQLNPTISKRIDLANIENNELWLLQEDINKMLCAMEKNRGDLLGDEKSKRIWLEDAVTKRTEALQVSNNKLKELAARDSLTGALNRGSFFETAQHMFVLSQRQKSVASFVLMDLDHFKQINDTYGHFIGDQVLIHFVHTIQDLLRRSDLIGRVGGEEFAVFLPDTDNDSAFRIADKIRKSIGSSICEIEGQSVSYTVSLGVESSETKDQSIDDIFKRADLKLYGAKGKGRNRVES